MRGTSPASISASKNQAGSAQAPISFAEVSFKGLLHSKPSIAILHKDDDTTVCH